MQRRSITLILVCLTLTACGGSTRVLVAAGTTVVDSGLIELLAERYEADHDGVQLSVVGEATAQILELGRRGGADVLLTHAPEAEEAFLASEDTTRYVRVFSSRFVVVGPLTQGAAFRGLSASQAFQAIADTEEIFVSRADGSGTNLAEQAIWREAGVDPAGRPWYLETGQGMGLTLQVADQRNGFTLSEAGAFRSAEAALGLVVIVDDPNDPKLDNPYHATVPARASEQLEAERFVDWLSSEQGQAAITEANRLLYGPEQLYRVP